MNKPQLPYGWVEFGRPQAILAGDPTAFYCVTCHKYHEAAGPAMRQLMTAQRIENGVAHAVVICTNTDNKEKPASV